MGTHDVVLARAEKQRPAAPCARAEKTSHNTLVPTTQLRRPAPISAAPRRHGWPHHPHRLGVVLLLPAAPDLEGEGDHGGGPPRKHHGGRSSAGGLGHWVGNRNGPAVEMQGR